MVVALCRGFGPPQLFPGYRTGMCYPCGAEEQKYGVKIGECGARSKQNRGSEGPFGDVHPAGRGDYAEQDNRTRHGMDQVPADEQVKGAYLRQMTAGRLNPGTWPDWALERDSPGTSRW